MMSMSMALSCSLRPQYRKNNTRLHHYHHYYASSLLYHIVSIAMLNKEKRNFFGGNLMSLDGSGTS